MDAGSTQVSPSSTAPTAQNVAIATASADETQQGRCSNRCCFTGFVFLLVSSITLTVVFFILAIFNILFVYVGVGCLAADLMIIAGYFIFLRCCRSTFKQRRQRTNRHNVDVNGVPRPRRGALNTPEARATEYRRLEREMHWLSTEIADLQSSSLCNTLDLERARDLVQRDCTIVSEWIEGVKVPETDEIQQLSRAVRSLAGRIQAIRMRSDRISESLVARLAPAYTSLSTSGPMTYPPPPPSYFESCPDIADLPEPQSRGRRELHVGSSTPRSVVSLSGSITPRSTPPTYEYAVGSSV